jgi:Protein of unknown function (DUF3108)
MLKKLILLFFLGLLLPCLPAFSAQTQSHPVNSLLGEKLEYDISFLWFDHLAEGTISLIRGEEDGTYLVTMEAKTLGVAAFFTRNRVETFKTLMRIGSGGLLQPIWHSSHTLRDKANGKSEKISRYTFDYENRQVRYQKIKNNRAYDDQWFELETDNQLFDILSALYNLRLGYFGSVGKERLLVPTFHRKGQQDIVIEPLTDLCKKDQKFFSSAATTARILVDPSVFGTKGRDVLASFDAMMRPQKGIIKNVIGLGDVRGTLRPPDDRVGGL